MTRLRSFLLLIVLLVLAPGWTHATEITVDAGGNCTLADAITAANTDTATGGCPTGSGDDTITLQADVTLAVALPIIASTITIEGSWHFIDGDSGNFSVLRVSSAGNLTLSDSTVRGSAGSSGGGIYNSGGILTLNNSIVSDNSVSNAGGGIYNNDGIVTLNNSIVSGNSASNVGGGIYSGSNSKLTLDNSTISGNSTSNAGGGIYSGSYNKLTLYNSTISGNSTSNAGGGLYNSGELILSNSTVCGNSVRNAGAGGGIYNGSNGELILTSSIVSGNTTAGSTGKEVYNGGTINADSFNLFGDNSETNAQAFFDFIPGSSDVNAASDGSTPTALAAILSPLADNDGPTQTHALPADSPAIDLDVACSTGLTTDQRGESRPMGDGCDAGSFEFTSTISSDIIVDAGGICTLADAITAANTDAATGRCPAGFGHDTIFLEINVLLAGALPVIVSTLTIEGQGHTIDGNDDPIVGSVLRVDVDGSLTLNKIIVTGGKSSIGGGGVYNEGTLILTNAKVNDNAVSCKEGTLSIGGGGIYSIGSLMLTDSMVIGNSVECNNGNAVLGGGIVNMSNLAIITNSIISDNSLSCNNCMMNETLTGLFWGGGIINIGTDSELIVDKSTVSNNSIFAFEVVGPQTSNISMPLALGGGIMNYGIGSASVTLTNSTVSGNAVLCDSCILHGYLNYGGGIASWNDDDTAPADVQITLINSTIIGNSVVGHGGGIGLLSGTAHLTGSIVSGNSGSEIVGLVISGSSNLIGHSGETNAQAFSDFIPGASDVIATSDGTNPTALAAILDTNLTDNGGPTKTHALVPGSPAIDLDVECSTGLTEDQRSEPRPIGDGCDAGSFEGSINPENSSAFLSAIYLLLLNQ